ncbi:class I SAM-dependent methyltransferase [Actinokineospora sp.]|uniref:class I SAM-dependent methyltransferase n=1 Tax=Actinokineospora sp. TaxID=1872133 RepID=UPI004038487A
MSDDAPTLLARMYGEDDLSSLPVFAGGFINFGYWRDIPLGPGEITVAQRVCSQLALYRLVFGEVEVSAEDRVLEVGCGLGIGGTWAATELGAGELHGVDLNPAQVARASERNAAAIAAAGGRLTFRQGAAEAIPFPDNTFDVAVSLEAAQHFADLAGFAAQAHRVLAPGGRLAVATFFLPDADHLGELPRRLETFGSGVDREHPLPVFLDHLRAAGFTAVRARSIGAHVWPGLDRWIAQLGAAESAWPRRWLPSWREGLIDYYLVTATTQKVRQTLPGA